jgi:hypothetical protein
VRTTRAYIASFGTTGTLIAALLLTMSVMSAIVAFDGFPSQDLQDPIGSVPVLDRQAPLSVEQPSANAGVEHGLGARVAAARRAHRHHGRAGSAKAPMAHANPMVHRESAGQRQQPTQTSGAVPATPVKVPDTGSVTQPVAHKVPSSPSLPTPDTLLKSAPVTLPGGATLPISLPVNTAAVSGVVDSLLGQ